MLLLQLCCQLPNPPAPQPGTSSSAGPVTPEQLFLLHTWQTYFSTVFKTGLTVSAQVGKANGDHRCFYLVLGSQSNCSASLAKDGPPAFGPRCLLSWLCGDRCGGGGATGDGTGSSRGRAARKRKWGLCDSDFYLRHSAATRVPDCTWCTPDLLMPRGFQSQLICAHIWVLGEVSAHPVSMGATAYLRNGPFYQGTHLSASLSGSPAQGTTLHPRSSFPIHTHIKCYRNVLS